MPLGLLLLYLMWNKKIKHFKMMKKSQLHVGLIRCNQTGVSEMTLCVC